MECYRSLLTDSQMIQLHVSIKQMKIGECMGVLHSFVWNYVKYANTEGFCRDSHIYQIMLGWKDALHLSVAYGNFEGLGKIKEWLSNMPTPKHSLLAKTIIWYLNGTNSQATSMQVSLASGTLYNVPNPRESDDWCDITKSSTLTKY